jgi:malonyl-CoA/methylmalonyl-CoA synthetase
MNLFELFRDRFPRDRQALFIRTRAGAVTTYADADHISARLAHVLRGHGARPGDRIAVQVEKTPQAVLLYLACLRAGLVMLPLNTAYRADELAYFVGDATPAIVIADPAKTEIQQIATAHRLPLLTLDAEGRGSLMDAMGEHTTYPTEARGHDDLAAILYSSGTTGRPKGVMLTHGNLASNAAALHAAWQFKPTDVLLHALPVFHVHGLFVALNTTLMNGTGMIFHHRFDADEVLADLPQATVFMGVPTYYTRLLAHPELTRDRCRHMRAFFCGSAPLLEDTFRQFEARTGHQIVERYGMTESGIITSMRLDRSRRPGVVGWPLPGVDVRIVGDGDTGEIQIRGPNVFKGYWNKPEKTAEDIVDGWFKTGDLGRFEPDGCVAIVGRAKDMMISGGFNVYPKEIEAEIDALPGVTESAVVGMPHPDFGEAGLAVITLAPGASLDEAAARAALRAKLANYKVPKMFVVADTLPRNAMGKVQKNVLRDTYRTLWERGLTG